MEEDEDDLYAPAGASNDAAAATFSNGGEAVKKEEDEDSKMDEQEDDDDSSGSDSDDVNFITEREDAGATSNQTDFRKAKAEPIRISSAAEPAAPSRVSAPTQVKLEPQNRGKITVVDGSKLPIYNSSKVDVDKMPVYDPAGKPLDEVDLDADIAMETKPWRVPGTDPTDFFNYGFDEQTWVAYCLRQKSMREEGVNLKEEFKQFQAMGMPGLPAMGGMGDGSEMTPEMFNAMFSGMQAQGMTDPSQMDFSMFQQMQQQMGGFGQNGQQDPNQFMGQQGQNQFGNQQGGGYEGFSPQQMNIMQQQQHHQGGGRGRGRGRKW